ncbi:hypothetical protein MKX01_038267 [Papaver californicum]|nr:hypothetical protein MKX01_038267 [Papaver californicum]
MDTAKKTSFFLLLFVFVLFNKPFLDSIAADTIPVGETLSGNQAITSKDGNFVMGFFTPGKSQTQYYIGIWYSYGRVSVQTVVWVANRDKPLTDPATSELKLLANGSLVLYDPSNSLIWSTNSASDTSNTTEAVLGDVGNLVLRDKHNPSVIIWQSFDYPTETWLHGGKIGLNKKTGVNKLLTSWRNQEAATGIFNLEIDPTGINQFLIRWNKSRSGQLGNQMNKKNSLLQSPR